MKRVLRFLALTIVCFSLVGLTACANNKPYIGENGNWWVNDEDLGVPAQGEKGDKGDNGKDGQSVSVVSVNKTSSNNNVDTYTITFSDNKTSTFTVTNGKDGKDGENGENLTISSISKTKSEGLVDTYTIVFSDNSTTSFTITNGKDGEVVTIFGIEKTSSVDLVDTYKVTYTDGNTFSFTVKNGKDGIDGNTPYIGENGNWWIDDTDTGVLADWEKANNIPLTIYSSGLQYETKTVGGKTGFVVTGWDYTEYDDDYLYSTLTTEELESFNHLEDAHLVIPNYVGSIPVIGVSTSAKLNFGKVTLSRNTVYLGEKAFYGCQKLKEIDFNGCELVCIPANCFTSTSLKSIDFPSTLTHVMDYAFDGVSLTSLNLKNIKYIGNHAFDDSFINYVYLKNTVEYVGSRPFDTTFIYVEAEEKPANWGNINDGAIAVVTNVKNNGEYLYSIENNEVTIYQYLGNEKKLIVPATIDGKPIVTIGCGFNYYSFDEDSDDGKTEAEIYAMLKNNDGYISELIVGNNVKKIDAFALLNGNMFIYVKSSVEEIYLSSADCVVGCFKFADEGETPFSLLVLENSTTTKFSTSSGLKTYEELLTIDDDYEWWFKANIAYDDIYFDENNAIYYHKTNNSYEVLAYRDSFADEVVVLDSINNLPVTTIGKWAFVCSFFDKLTIGSNVNKIKSSAIIECKGDVFIPNSVSIINANGLYLSSGSTIYAEASAKKDDWDSNWNANSTEVVYSTTKQAFASMFKYGDFSGNIKNDGTIELTKYNGTYKNGMTIKIPRKINGKTVASIKGHFFYENTSYTNVKIYIPSTVQIVETNAFDCYISTSSSSYYPSFYLEASEVPTGFESNWYYNTYYSSTSNFKVYLGQELDY